MAGPLLLTLVAAAAGATQPYGAGPELLLLFRRLIPAPRAPIALSFSDTNAPRVPFCHCAFPTLPEVASDADMIPQLPNGALRASYLSRVHRRPCPSRLLTWTTRTAAAPSSCALFHATTPAQAASRPPPQDVAILGGGLTGLTTAYYLTRFNPQAKVTIYEASDRLGGWIDDERIQVTTQTGKAAIVTLERGARVVAPKRSITNYDHFVLYDLV